MFKLKRLPESTRSVTPAPRVPHAAGSRSATSASSEARRRCQCSSSPPHCAGDRRAPAFAARAPQARVPFAAAAAAVTPAGRTGTQSNLALACIHSFMRVRACQTLRFLWKQLRRRARGVLQTARP
eukprot:27041-Pleurochrysis_carterae.AAC.2